MPPRLCIRATLRQRSAQRACCAIMPLRAKIMVPGGSSRAYATEQRSSAKIRDEDPLDVIFDKQYGVRTINLNRPKKLNALNGSMAGKILARLQEWENSELASVIIMKGTGKALCAGGDVATLASAIAKGPEGIEESRKYFELEYQLDHLIATYPKPYVSFMDGITMGGGAGLSMHGPFRIATENTVFAMPETAIGLFPDVGAGFFLPRLDGQVGTYLALTGTHVKGVNALYHGIATHYIHSTSLPQLEARLAELVFKDYYTLTERNDIVNHTIDEFATGLPHDERMQMAGEVRQKIDYFFDRRNKNITDIVDGLENAAENNNDTWAEEALNTLKKRSPTSLAVTARQMRLGENWNIAETFQHEYNMACKFVEHPDFVNGVGALLIKRSKEPPEWKPSNVHSLGQHDVEKFFVKDRILQLLRTSDAARYTHYPHAKYGLPSEVDIITLIDRRGWVSKVNGGEMTVRGMVEQVVEHYEHKLGVKEKVTEVLKRRIVPQTS